MTNLIKFMKDEFHKSNKLLEDTESYLKEEKNGLKAVYGDLKMITDEFSSSFIRVYHNLKSAHPREFNDLELGIKKANDMANTVVDTVDDIVKSKDFSEGIERVDRLCIAAAIELNMLGNNFKRDLERFAKGSEKKIELLIDKLNVFLSDLSKGINAFISKIKEPQIMRKFRDAFEAQEQKERVDSRLI